MSIATHQSVHSIRPRSKQTVKNTTNYHTVMNNLCSLADVTPGNNSSTCKRDRVRYGFFRPTRVDPELIICLVWFVIQRVFFWHVLRINKQSSDSIFQNFQSKVINNRNYWTDFIGTSRHRGKTKRSRQSHYNISRSSSLLAACGKRSHIYFES